MTIQQQDSGHLAWIDWMKAIGIFLIVYGHFFSLGHWYVYTFSVPLFFVISGFLCKRETDTKVFWKKLWFNLIVPMLLASVISLGIKVSLAISDGAFDPAAIYNFPIRVLIGSHKGLGTLWFVYTLIILKILLQFAPRGRVAQVGLLVAFPLIGVLLNHYAPEIPKRCLAPINVCMAYPFFMIGFWLKRIKPFLIECRSVKFLLASCAICSLIVFVCTKLNEGVWMYIDGCGNNIFLFLIGGMTGIALIFSVSKLIPVLPPPIVNVSKGTIIILAFHPYLIPIARTYFPNPSLCDGVFSAIIVLLFVPVIMFAERHLPYLMGKYRVAKK